MTPIEKGIALSDLNNIGTVEVLGATIEEGEARAYLKPTLGTPEDAEHAAYFGVDQCVFTMVYPFTEQACVVTGEVELTDQNSGQTVHYKPGDSWLIEKGTPVRWVIKTPEFVKHYHAVV